jgi:hypothetical protein
MTAEVSRLIVDTSTLLGLGPPRGMRASEFKLATTGAIEALVLFEELVPDRPTVREHDFNISWLANLLDGAQLVNFGEDVRDLYLRAGSLFQRINWPEQMADLVDRGAEGREVSYEMPGLGYPRDKPCFDLNDPRNGMLLSALWELRGQTTDRFGRKTNQWIPFEEASIADIFVYLANYSADLPGLYLSGVYSPEKPGRLTQRPKRLVSLIRHFYYLALQEKMGGSLLLHPNKSFGRLDSPSYGYAANIIGAFDERVQTAYAQRQKEWLGEKPRTIPVPALSRYVLAKSDSNGWSIGRTIAWLRERPEVTSFRQGMQQFIERIEGGDDLAVDTVLAELDRQAEAWSTRLGVDSRRKGRIFLQVALPFVQFAIEIPVPWPTRNPAEKMLVLIRMIESNK